MVKKPKNLKRKGTANPAAAAINNAARILQQESQQICRDFATKKF